MKAKAEVHTMKPVYADSPHCQNLIRQAFYSLVEIFELQVRGRWRQHRWERSPLPLNAREIPS